MLPVLVPSLAVVASVHAAPPSPAATAVPRRFFGLPTGNPFLAGTLSLALNGLGQAYNGEDDKSRLMMGSLLTFPMAYGVDVLTGKAYMRTFSFAIITAVKAWSVWDAMTDAKTHP